MPINTAIATRIRNNLVMNVRPNTAIANNMGTEILNPPAPLVRKLMELQAELRQAFPNNPNIVVAFNGQGGCLIGMETQAMQNLMQTVNPALNQHTRQNIGQGNVRGYIG